MKGMDDEGEEFFGNLSMRHEVEDKIVSVDRLDDDLILDDEEDRRSGSKSKKSKSGEMNSSFMFFDFRRGPQKFPRNVCVVSANKMPG